MIKDPVCNMEVNEHEALTTKYDGERYFFCSEGCQEKFLQDKAKRAPRHAFDLIIIGGGPAGLTAAVYAATLKLDAFLIAKDLGGQAIDSTNIENYMGFDFITGPELIEQFQYQLIHTHYLEHHLSEVDNIEPFGNEFHVTTSHLKTYTAKTLIMATGMTRRKLKVQGEERFQRKGIFYGNIQDFSFVQGKDVAVIGGGNSAIQLVETLHPAARHIHLISDFALTADAKHVDHLQTFENLTIYEGYRVLEFNGEKTLSGVSIGKKAEDATVQLAVQGAFIAIGLQPNSAVVSELVDVNDRREIIINPDCSTSYPGIFAAGDVTNAFGKRIIIASAEGAKAAMAARQVIVKSR